MSRDRMDALTALRAFPRTALSAAMMELAAVFSAWAVWCYRKSNATYREGKK